MKIDVKDEYHDKNYPKMTLLVNNQGKNQIWKESYLRKKKTICAKSELNELESFIYSTVDCFNSKVDEIVYNNYLNNYQMNTGIYFQSFTKKLKMINLSKARVTWMNREAIHLLFTMEIINNFTNRTMDSSKNFFRIFQPPNNESIYIEYIMLHSDPIPNSFDYIIPARFFPFMNLTIVISKTLISYLELPSGGCSHYRTNSGQPYNAISHMDCYRKCLAYHSIELLGCVPLFIAETIHERDIEFLGTKLCSLEKFKIFISKANNHLGKRCKQNCPKNCLTVSYHSRTLRNEYLKLERVKNDKFVNEISFLWDSSQPMVIYKEESVTSFTDYLCYCGGLIG